MITSFDLTGFDELQKTLDGLVSVKTRTKMLRRGSKIAMDPVLADAKRNAPSLTSVNSAINGNAIAGELKNSIKTSVTVIMRPL